MNWRVLFFSGLLLLTLSGHFASAQIIDKIEQVKIDTNYIEAYKDELTVRVFVSRKQKAYNLSSRLFSPWVKYRTNDNLLLGLGYTYNFLTLNLAVKMPFINQDDDVYGKSSYFDLNFHTTFRSYIIDLYLQWNTGYFVSNPEKVDPSWDPGTGYPIRGDLRTQLLGLNVQYLFNSSRYSYKAAFLQNEFQKRSAGSPIAGIEAYYMLGMSDSVMVAGNIPPSGFLDDNPFNQVDIANFGVNGGYAYTFVWKEKLFLSLSTVFGISGGYNQVHYTNNSVTYRSGLTAGVTNSTRISFGFNRKGYYVGLSYRHFSLSNMSPGYADWFAYSTGEIRINFVKRFQLKRSIVILRPDLWILQ
jgi:hypothetical protein